MMHIDRQIQWPIRIIPLAMLLAILLPLTFLADTAQARSLDMEKVIIDAELLPDASMQVTEHLTIDFSGQWNGFNIAIPRGSSPIQEVSVSEKGQPYTFNPGKDYGPPGTYLTKIENNNMVIDWSVSAKDETRTFDVSYRVMNAVKIHDDVAELYRKFIGNSNQEKIAQVKVNLILPAGAENYKQGEDIRIWGHGPLQGEVDFAGANLVTWQTKNLPARTFVEGRVVMPTALFPAASAQLRTRQTALPGILAQEEGWAKQANQERMAARAEYAGGAGIIAVALGMIFWLRQKYGRKYQTQFQGDYYRDLPGSYSPAELSVLWNFRKIKAQDLTATILDLARRKFLYLEEDTREVRKFLGTKEVTTYLISFMPAPEPAMLRKPEEAELRPHEQQLLSFLQNDIGGGRGYIYLSEIENYAQKYGQAFHAFWQEWQTELIDQGENLDFFDNSGNMPLFTVLLGLGLLILGSSLVAKAGVIGAALIIAGALFLFIPRLFKRRTLTGQEDYVRWQAFKKFLQHFSEMERHEIPSLIIWEHYLVYAVTLGVAKEVIKQLELVFPNMQEGDHQFGYGWMSYGAYGSMSALHHSFDGIESSFERALQSAQKAVSKTSSGSGGGGGFSSGGGGGGGGSSYGGR